MGILALYINDNGQLKITPNNALEEVHVYTC